MSRRDRKTAATSSRWKRYCLLSVLGLLCIGLLFGLKRDPKDLLRKGLLSNRPEEKIELLRRSIEAAGGDYHEAEIELCMALARSKDWTSFNNVFSGLELNRCTGAELLALARLCVQGKQWPAAEAILAAVERTAHSTEDYLVVRCGLSAGTNRIRDLVSGAEELTRLYPEKVQYWWQLASIHEQRENTLAAITTYQAAIRQPLPKLEIIRMRHRILDHAISVGDAVLAREQLSIVARESLPDPRIDVYEARLCHLEGRPAEALVALERALGVLGELPEALRLRGILHLELGNLKQAAADLTRVVSLSPNDEIACFNLAQALKRVGQDQSDTATIQLAEVYHQKYLSLRAENLKKLERARKAVTE